MSKAKRVREEPTDGVGKRLKPILSRFDVERVDDPPVVSSRNTGVTTGLGLYEFFAKILEENERLPRTQKHTDEMLRQVVIEEFPESACATRLREGSLTIAHWRSKYNKGQLLNRLDVPVKRSLRYNLDGIPISRRASLLPWERYPPHAKTLYKSWYRKEGKDILTR